MGVKAHVKLQLNNEKRVTRPQVPNETGVAYKVWLNEILFSHKILSQNYPCECLVVIQAGFIPACTHQILRISAILYHTFKTSAKKERKFLDKTVFWALYLVLSQPYC